MKLPSVFFRPWCASLIKLSFIFNFCVLSAEIGLGNTPSKYNSTAQIDSLIDVTWPIKYQDPVSFRLQSQDILEAANRLNYTHGIAYGNSYMGVFHYLQDRYDSAQYYFDISLSYFEENEDNSGIARTHNYRGLCFDAMDDYENALEEYNKALAIKQQLDDDLSLANTLNNIGTLYISGKKFDKALELLEKAQTIYKHHESKNGMAMVLNNIGLVYDEKGDFENAIEYYLGSLNLEESYTTDSENLALSYNNIGSLYADNLRYDEATFYYNRALELYNKTNSLSGIALVRNNLSEAYRNLNSTEESIHEASVALELADSINATEDLQMAHENLARSYKQQQNFQKALFHFEKSILLKDSLSKMRYETELADMRLSFVMAENYKTLQNEQFRIVRYGRDKNVQQILLIIGVLSILIVFGVHGNWISIDLKIVEVLLVVGVMCLFEGVALLYNEFFSGTGELESMYRYAGHLVLFSMSVIFILYARRIAKSEA